MQTAARGGPRTRSGVVRRSSIVAMGGPAMLGAGLSAARVELIFRRNIRSAHIRPCRAGNRNHNCSSACWASTSRSCTGRTCVEIKILWRVRAESSRRPPRHRRDACSAAWRCRVPNWLISTQGRTRAGPWSTFRHPSSNPSWPSTVCRTGPSAASGTTCGRRRLCAKSTSESGVREV